MPKVCCQDGWQIVVHPNENFEKFHVHVINADKSGKFNLTRASRKIEVVRANSMKSNEIKYVKQIIGDNFEKCWEVWAEAQKHRGSIGYSS